MYEITGGLVPPVFVFRRPQIILIFLKIGLDKSFLVGYNAEAVRFTGFNKKLETKKFKKFEKTS